MILAWEREVVLSLRVGDSPDIRILGIYIQTYQTKRATEQNERTGMKLRELEELVGL